MIIRICVIFNELVKGEQAASSDRQSMSSAAGKRMAHDAFVGSGGPNRFRDLLKSLLFCSEEAEFVLSDIRTAFINGAGVGGIFYQRADDRFGQIECFAFSRIRSAFALPSKFSQRSSARITSCSCILHGRERSRSRRNAISVQKARAGPMRCPSSGTNIISLYRS